MDFNKQNLLQLEKTKEDLYDNNKVTNSNGYILDATHNHIIFPIGNRKVLLHPFTKEYLYFEMYYDKLATDARNLLLNSYNKDYTDILGLIKFCESTIMTFINDAIKTAEIFGKNFKYNKFYDYIMPVIKENCTSFLTEILELKDKYLEVEKATKNIIDLEKFKKLDLFQQRLNSITNTLKTSLNNGTITTVTKKALSRRMSNVAIAIDNIKTMTQGEWEFKKLYSNPDFINNLCDNIYQDILNFKSAIRKVSFEIYGEKIPCLFNENNKKHSAEIYKNLKNDFYSENVILDKVLEMLIEYPLNEDYYSLAMVHSLDGIYNLKNYAEYFFIDYHKAREKALIEINYNNEIFSIYENASKIFEQDLKNNIFYNELKFKFSKHLFKNIKSALDYHSFNNTFYVYESITDGVKEKVFQAFESFANFNSDIPLILYEENSNYKGLEGLLISTEYIYFTNNSKEKIVINIMDITNITIDKNELYFNNESTVISKIPVNERDLFLQFLEYIIYMIKYIKLYNGYNLRDILYLRYQYLGNGNTLNSCFGETKLILENKLFKNRLYHKVKGTLTGDLHTDLAVIIPTFNSNKIIKMFPTMEDSNKIKLENAINCYANIKDEIPLILYDSTAFNTGKEGFIVTNKAFYYKPFMKNFIKIDINSINKISFINDKLVINDIEIEYNSIPISDRFNFKNSLELLLYRLRIEIGIDPTVRKPLTNQLKLNKLFNYNIDSSYKFEVDYTKSIDLNISKLLTDICNSKIRPMIFTFNENEHSKKKFTTATELYIDNNIEEQGYFLFDNIKLNGCRESIFLTNKAIYWKNPWSSCNFIFYKDINSFDVDEKNIIINEDTISITSIPSHFHEDFKDILISVINIIKTMTLV